MNRVSRKENRLSYFLIQKSKKGKKKQHLFTAMVKQINTKENNCQVEIRRIHITAQQKKKIIITPTAINLIAVGNC